MKFEKYTIEFLTAASMQMQKLPLPIREAVFFWKESVERMGLPEAKKARGYRDEPLKGRSKGERSVRLSGACQLIYREYEEGDVVIVDVQEGNENETG